MRIIFVVLLFYLFSCTNAAKVPKDILSKNKMELVLWDIIQAERFSALFILKDSSTKNVELERFKLYDQIFSMHQVSREKFVESYKYYLRRPDIAKVIFDSMAVKAERQKTNNYRGDTLK